MAPPRDGWGAEADIEVSAPPERVWEVVSDTSRQERRAGPATRDWGRGTMFERQCARLDELAIRVAQVGS